VRGLGTHALRARAWPLLLGAARPALSDAADLAAAAAADHRDRSTVDVDVARSLWAFTAGWGEARRDAARDGLKRVLNAAVAAGAGTADGLAAPVPTLSPAASADASAQQQQKPQRPPPAARAVHYYQGLHDVASVLLLVTRSEAAAFRLLRRLCVGPLRDCTRPTLSAALAALSALPALLAAADPALAAHLAGTPPHYALPWHLTWFAHGVPPGPGALDGAARLFDLFAATHPLMPLYVGAAALVACREALLAVDGDDPGEVHAAIGRLPHLGGLDPDVAALRALELYAAHPPAALVAWAGRAARGGGAGGAARAWLRRRRLGGALDGGGSLPRDPSNGPGLEASAAASARLGGGGFWEVDDAALVQVAGGAHSHLPPKKSSDDGQATATPLASQGNVLTTVVVTLVGAAVAVLAARSGGGGGM